MSLQLAMASSSVSLSNPSLLSLALRMFRISVIIIPGNFLIIPGYSENLPNYSWIFPDSFPHPLCLKLYWHNRRMPRLWVLFINKMWSVLISSSYCYLVIYFQIQSATTNDLNINFFCIFTSLAHKHKFCIEYYLHQQQENLLWLLFLTKTFFLLAATFT